MIKYEKNDALVFLSGIKSNSVDLILIDAPYIISKKSGYTNNAPDKTDYIAKYGKHTIDFGEWDKQELNLENIISESYRVLKPKGTFICFYDFWKIPELKECAEKFGFKQPRLCCWNKTNPVPINSKLNYLSNAKEFFITFVKKSKPTFNSQYDNGEYYCELEDCDTYFLPICHGKERSKHPTQKPLALIKDLISKHSNENDFVIDFFAGSGTTGVACKELNRNCAMCEINEEYVEIIKKRIEQMA